MSPHPVVNWAVLVATFLLISVHVGIFLHKLDRHAYADWVRAARAQCLKWFLRQRLRGAAAAAAGGGKEPSLPAQDPVEREVEEIILTKRLRIAELVHSWGSTFFFGVAAMVVGRLFRDADEVKVLTTFGDFTVLILYLVVLCLRAAPRLVCGQSIPYLYATGMLMGTLLVTPWSLSDAVFRPHLNSLMVGYRLFLNMTTSNLIHVFSWNVAYTVAVILTDIHGHRRCEDYVLTNRQYYFEMGACCYLMIVAYAVESTLKAQTRQEIEGRRAKDESCAATSLLNAITDAVVVLDDELRIVRDSPQLSTMLLRGPGGSLAGLTLEQFVAPGGWEDFTARLLDKDVLSTSLANVLHLHMKDSWGNTIEVEIFHVCTRASSLNDQHIHHILGIREYGSSDYLAQRGEQPPYHDGNGLGAGRHVPSIPSSLEMDAGQVMITFDAFTSKTTKYSSSFISLCGGHPAVQIFWEWVPSRVRRSAKEYFTELVNNFMNSEDVESTPSCLQGLRFKVPLPTSQARFFADCTFTLHADVDDEEGEEDDDIIRATVVFTNILVTVRADADGDNVADDSREGADGGGA